MRDPSHALACTRGGVRHNAAMVRPDPNNENTFQEISIPSTLQDAKRPEIAILKEVEKRGFCQEAIFAIKLALEEAMTNAVKHGNGSDPNKRVTVRYAVDNTRAVIIVRDEGGGFQPTRVPDPTRSDRLTLPTGRGIMLMRAYMDEVSFRHDGTEVCLVKLNK